MIHNYFLFLNLHFPFLISWNLMVIYLSSLLQIMNYSMVVVQLLTTVVSFGFMSVFSFLVSYVSSSFVPVHSFPLSSSELLVVIFSFITNNAEPAFLFFHDLSLGSNQHFLIAKESPRLDPKDRMVTAQEKSPWEGSCHHQETQESPSCPWVVTLVIMMVTQGLERRK